MEVRVRVREESPGRWVAETDGDPLLRTTGASSERCLAALRRALERAKRGMPDTIVVEVVPRLAGVAEAARIMGWDKRRVVTYIDRGSFPPPVQSLAATRVWLSSDVEQFAREWRAKQARRARRP